MAQNVKVIRQTLAAGAATGTTTDFTSSGFGTPTAAIVIMNLTGPASNPSANANISIGFWDAASQRVVNVGTGSDGAAASDTFRFSDNSYAAASVTGTISAAYSISNITDGIRLTLAVDNTTFQRFATVILFTGVSAKLVDLTTAASQNATAETASLGFEPALAFFATIGNTAVDTAANTSHSHMSFGVADSNGVHRSITFAWYDGAADENAALLYSETRCAAKDSGWGAEVTTWGADTLTVTTRDAAGGDILFVLALGGADLSYDMGTLSTATSATTQQNATDISPDALIVALSTATGTTAHTDSGANGFMVGLADDNGQFCHNVSVEDGAATMNENSASQAARVIDLDTSVAGSVTNMCDATVALNDTDFTLSFSAADATARKGWWVAFGAVPAAAGDVLPQGIQGISSGIIASAGGGVSGIQSLGEGFIS